MSDHTKQVTKAILSDKLSLVAIGGIVLLEGIALIKGIDGRFFVPAIVLIAGLGGYKVGKIFNEIINK